MKTSPIYTHDCSQCIFVGTYVGGTFANSEIETFDLYYHPADQSGPATVIARNGNEGDDYQSGMSHATPDGMLPLYQARLNAIELGLIK